MPKAVQLGTVIEAHHEFKSARIAKKRRAPTIMDELMQDQQFRAYSKRTYDAIHHDKQRGKKRWRTKQERR